MTFACFQVASSCILPSIITAPEPSGIAVRILRAKATSAGSGENTRLAMAIWLGCRVQAPAQPSRKALRNCASQATGSEKSPNRRQASQPVRAVDGDHPQRQGGQAQRVRQDGQAPGGREPDHRRLRGVRPASQPCRPVDPGDRGASGKARAPARLVAADAAFYSGKNEAAAKAKGVKRVCVPNRSTKSSDRKREQKKRLFRNGQKWRTGSEGRISVVKRRHGLDRCRYKGNNGMRRWVGLGVIGDNLISIGNALAKRADL